jgi:hypothetical protein
LLNGRAALFLPFSFHAQESYSSPLGPPHSRVQRESRGECITAEKVNHTRPMALKSQQGELIIRSKAEIFASHTHESAKSAKRRRKITKMRKIYLRNDSFSASTMLKIQEQE